MHRTFLTKGMSMKHVKNIKQIASLRYLTKWQRNPEFFWFFVLVLVCFSHLSDYLLKPSNYIIAINIIIIFIIIIIVIITVMLIIITVTGVLEKKMGESPKQGNQEYDMPLFIKLSDE